jgi:hypothetical protein
MKYAIEWDDRPVERQKEPSLVGPFDSREDAHSFAHRVTDDGSWSWMVVPIAPPDDGASARIGGEYPGRIPGYIEAPEEWYPSLRSSAYRPSVFLAGGITECPDWQADAARLLDSVAVLNPRRRNFPMDHPSAAHDQIGWEFRHLHRANVVLFWFPESTSAQPGALYELGRHAALDRPIAVGVDPAYARATDVREQLALARPSVTVHDNLLDVCREAVWLTGSSAGMS